jgi:aspartate-semialdehyde dehydrogenase
MAMLRVGIVGWRGMVGSVLVQRMREERDFDHIEPLFFSTSQAGGKAPEIGKSAEAVKNASDVGELKKLPVIISCQGGDYTNEIYPKLRKEGWKGYWIDAASARGERAANEGRRGHHSRPGQHAPHRVVAEEGRA